MHILITGADGFVGSSLASSLKFSIKKLTLTTRDRSKCGGSLVYGNCISSFDWTHILKDVDVVVHCAGIAHKMTADAENIEDYYEVNTRGTLNLVRQASQRAKLFIFISTLKVHGEFTLNGAINADSRLNPKDDYAKSKLEAEEGLRQISNSSNMDYLIIRPPLIFGSPFRGNLSSISKLVQLKLPMPIKGLIDNKRALVSIENLIDFITTCIASSAGRNQTYLVRDACHYSTYQIFQMTSMHLGKELRSFYISAVLLRLILKLLGKQQVIEKLFYNYEIDIDKNYEKLAWKPNPDLQSRK